MTSARQEFLAGTVPGRARVVFSRDADHRLLPESSLLLLEVDDSAVSGVPGLDGVLALVDRYGGPVAGRFVDPATTRLAFQVHVATVTSAIKATMTVRCTGELAGAFSLTVALDARENRAFLWKLAEPTLIVALSTSRRVGAADSFAAVAQHSFLLNAHGSRGADLLCRINGWPQRNPLLGQPRGPTRPDARDAGTTRRPR